MIIEAYFRELQGADVLRALHALPAHLSPSRFSADEEGGKMERMDDLPRFQSFAQANPYGFFLFSDQLTYNVRTRPKNGFFSVEAESVKQMDDSDVIAVLKTVAAVGSVFSFAACAEEYLHRNRYSRTVGDNVFEAWLGRDLRKYLPGIYWLTVLSQEYHGILASLTALKPAVVQLDSTHWLIRAYENCDHWKRHAATIDDWIARQPAVFSKQRIRAQLDTAPHLSALTQLASNWN